MTFALVAILVLMMIGLTLAVLMSWMVFPFLVLAAVAGATAGVGCVRDRRLHVSMSRSPRSHGAVIALLAIGLSVGCSDAPSASSADAAAYTARAEEICRVGRARLRDDPGLRDSTTVLAHMERQLRELGQPPQALDALGPDVPASLARITWAAESFDVAGRYEMDGIIITLDDVRALGFRVCGTR